MSVDWAVFVHAARGRRLWYSRTHVMVSGQRQRRLFLLHEWNAVNEAMRGGHMGAIWDKHVHLALSVCFVAKCYMFKANT